jgi:hypothetical protein
MANYVVVWAMMFLCFVTGSIISPDEWHEYLIGTVGLGLFISFLGWLNRVRHDYAIYAQIIVSDPIHFHLLQDASH